MIRLRNTAPLVKFRAEFPAHWEPKGAAFIEIDARPAGRINTAFMAAREEVILSHPLRDLREVAREREVTPDDIRSVRAFNRAWVAMTYDTCVITWRTNMIDDATMQPLTCDAATFLELAEMPVDEMAAAFLRFQADLQEAGEKAIAETEATIKN